MINLFKKERKPGGLVEYTGVIPAFIVFSLIFIVLLWFLAIDYLTLRWFIDLVS